MPSLFDKSSKKCKHAICYIQLRMSMNIVGKTRHFQEPGTNQEFRIHERKWSWSTPVENKAYAFRNTHMLLCAKMFIQRLNITLFMTKI